MNMDRKKIDVYIGTDYLSKLDFIKKALPLPTTNLIVWLLFRGFLDYHHNKKAYMKSLKQYRYMGNTNRYTDQTKETEHRSKVQIYISVKLEEALNIICKNQIHMKRQEFFNKTIKMELDNFSKCLYEDEDAIRSKCKEKKEDFYIPLNSYLLERLKDISEKTGIRLSSLIPLMLFEYLNILDEARYK